MVRMFATLFLLTVSLMLSAQSMVKIKLQIQDVESKQPIAEAPVELNGKLLGFTDAEGIYWFNDAVKDRAYTFMIKPIDYEMKSEKRYAREEINLPLAPMEFRTIASLIEKYQEELRRDSPDKKNLDAWYTRIMTGLDNEINLVQRNEFLKTNATILEAKENQYKVDLQPRDADIKPVIRYNNDKLTEHKR